MDAGADLRGISPGEFLVGTVGADDGSPVFIQAGVDQRIERTDGHRCDHLGSQVIKDHQIAGEHALNPNRSGLGFFRIAGKLLPLKGIERGGGGIVADGIALFGHDAGNAGGEIGLAETRAALKEQVWRAPGEIVGIAAAGLRDLFHHLARH